MGLNLELHKFDAFWRFEATVQLQIEATEKILGKSFTFGVRSVENCCKKGTSKNLTTPTLHTPKLSLMIAYDYIQIYSGDTFSSLELAFRV